MKLLYKYSISLLCCSLFLSGCQSYQRPAKVYPILDAVNFGGIYVLEDWFFSSRQLGHEVSTSCRHKQVGVGSSNIFLQTPNAQDFTWTSEIHLIRQLLDKGYSEEEIANLFQQHRDSYLLQEQLGPRSLDDNFTELKSLGVKLVRLPVTWALTFPERSYTIDPGNGKKPVIIPASDEVVLIPDPFYPEGRWASIPITQIENILKVANKYDIKVLLEVHAYPGGAGDGTFNGVWPNPPRFWTASTGGKGELLYQKNFKVIFNNLISWAEGLFELDDQSYGNALAGLSPINEPAHLMGIPEARCDQNSNWGIDSPTEVLDTLAISITDFKQSQLPQNDVKLYLNVIETMFDTANPLSQIGDWWLDVTNISERNTWAVLDVHHYIAWDSEFNNCLEEYVEENIDGTLIINKQGFDKVRKSTAWFTDLRKSLGLSPLDLLSTSEFSASTNSETYKSCASGVAKNEDGKDMIIGNSREYRNHFIDSQIEAANTQNIEAMFWTWMLPYNQNYKNEWSMYSICSQDDSPKFCDSEAVK